MVFPVETEERVKRKALDVSRDHLREVVEISRKIYQLIVAFVENEKDSAQELFNKITDQSFMGFAIIQDFEIKYFNTAFFVFKKFGKIEHYGRGSYISTEGTGLGLYISKKLVELHGGEIWMESEGRNKGSTFYFSLPIIKE